jgi:hypothetical protein
VTPVTSTLLMPLAKLLKAHHHQRFLDFKPC